ncbi:MAG: glycosyltransferase [Bacteroidales bacterium]|nr:glycosyltransferase [Bacteroidales bacterium]
MRILLVLKRFEFGGAENHVCDLANALSELNHDVFLVTANGRQVSRLNLNVKFIPCRFRDIILPFNVIQLYWIVKKYNIDIIHAHQRLSILASCILRKFVDIPVVVTVHGRTRLDLKSKFTQSTSDKIIFVSNHVLNVSACYHEIKEKSTVIPNGVEVISLVKGERPYSITYVSRIDRNHSKVILVIIQKVIPMLIKKFPDITFNLIGEGNCLNLIRKESLRINNEYGKEICKVFGYQTDVKEFFLNSSLILGVGRVSLEALACGVPVLSINQKRLGSIISTANYADYKENNFVAIGNEPPNADEIYTILNDFFNEKEKYCTEAKEIQGLVKHDFSLKNIACQIVNLYAEAINYNRKSS